MRKLAEADDTFGFGIFCISRASPYGRFYTAGVDLCHLQKPVQNIFLSENYNGKEDHASGP